MRSPSQGGGDPTCDYPDCNAPEPLVADSNFVLDIIPESEEISGEPNTTVRFNVTVRLTAAESPVQAWSISIAASGDADFSIVGASSAEFPGSVSPIEMTELIDGRGDQGVVTAVIPGLVSGFQLDPCDAPVNLLHLTIEAVVPEYGDRSVTLDFVDGLQGSGQEVQNRLTVNRNSTLPEFGSCEVTISAQGKYGGGTGEPNDPYQIWDANDMQAIGADANDWDRCFVLMADIDLSAYTEEEFNIIGYASANPWDGQPFFGVFDGNDHTISNFTYVSDGRNFAGLFGVVGGEIKNLGLIDPNVNAGRGIMRRRREVVGSLTGFLIDESAVTNCYSKGGSVTGDRVVGGLVGRNSRGAIILSYWDIETSGEPNMCDNPEDPNCDNSHGLPTSQLHQQSTFQDWDFINVWNIGENQTYPYLRTVSASDINKDRITNFLDLCIVGEQWMDEE